MLVFIIYENKINQNNYNPFQMSEIIYLYSPSRREKETFSIIKCIQAGYFLILIVLNLLSSKMKVVYLCVKQIVAKLVYLFWCFKTMHIFCCSAGFLLWSTRPFSTIHPPTIHPSISPSLPLVLIEFKDFLQFCLRFCSNRFQSFALSWVFPNSILIMH